MKSLPPPLGILLFLPLSSFAQSANVPPAPLDNSGFEDRHPEGMFSSIVTAHGQEMVMGQARSFQIVPVKPTKTFSADVPEIFVVDRKSTRLNSSHDQISYAVFCLK